jgi:ABC-type amino acid transport substrate-binding protein
MAYAQSDLLNSEENIWLSSRNNTLHIIPERNNPPFSFNDSSYISQGIFIDYIKLVSEKLNIKVDFLTSRSRAEIISGMNENKADYVSSLELGNDTSDFQVSFTDPYSIFPVVIAVRKDYDSREGMTLDDFNNRSVAIIRGSPIGSYIKKNYPRIIIQDVVDNELALQKVALNEVDATVINSASLTYLLSKQSMRSIKVVGSVPLDSKMAFVVPKDKVILSSILNKGLKQVGAKEHQQIIDRWISLPNEKTSSNAFFLYLNENLDVLFIALLFIVIIIGMFILFRKMNFNIKYKYFNKTSKLNELEKEIEQLEDASKGLISELEDVKGLEKEIKEKIKNIEN